MNRPNLRGAVAGDRFCPMHMPARSFIFALLIPASFCRADDWPQWMGPQRDDRWREKGVVDRFPQTGPSVLWRVPINGGYCGPAVAGNRLFVLDRPTAEQPAEKEGQDNKPVKKERVLCMESSTGKKLWEHSYPCSYNIGYPGGPRATPTVTDGRVFTLGAMGDLLCLQADS